MYSYGPPHMAVQNQDDQLEHTYSSYVRIRDIALTTSRRRRTIGRIGERGSEISVQSAWHDDDDDDGQEKNKKLWVNVAVYRLPVSVSSHVQRFNSFRKNKEIDIFIKSGILLFLMAKHLLQNQISIPFPVQNGNSSVQNGNNSVLNRKIIISINIKNIL